MTGSGIQDTLSLLSFSPIVGYLTSSIQHGLVIVALVRQSCTKCLGGRLKLDFFFASVSLSSAYRFNNFSQLISVARGRRFADIEFTKLVLGKCPDRTIVGPQKLLLDHHGMLMN